MRRPLMILAAMLLAGGCTASRPAPIAQAYVPSMPSASALAFTPPVAYDVADELDLDRDGRRQIAYGGVETVVISESWVQQDDRQRFGRFGDNSQFERRAVSTRVTISGR